MSLLFTVLAALLGCSEADPPGNGQLDICLAGPADTVAAGDFDLVVSGTVTGVDGEAPDWNLVHCAFATHRIQVTDDAGEIWTVGLSVTRFEEDHTPAFDVREGIDVDLTFRQRLVWGTVQGFSLESEDELIAAVEGGSWGGALNDDDALGLIVTRTGDPIDTEKSECMYVDTYLTRFDADEIVEIEPMHTDTITLDGNAFVAMPVAAYETRDGKRCIVSDVSDGKSWIIYR